jgi:acetate kinase
VKRAQERLRSNPSSPCVLAINAGSSSIRFAVYEAGNTLRQRLDGKVDRIGSGGHRAAASDLLEQLEAAPVFASLKAVGHRVVHGMKHASPERITPKLLAELRHATPYDPEHLPREIALIEAFSRRHPKLPQVACFDTAFHRGMPRVAKMLPIPGRYAAKGVERYGFHGISYAYLMEELNRLDPVAAKGRTILAHLGNGASLAAVRGGKSIDTSMGFTPASGLVMSSRTGDLDPGLAYFLARTERMTAARFQRMVNHECGLLGISGTSADLRDLLQREARDARAADAVALFCYQAKKWIGSFAAALGGLDTLVFAGGIGENSPLVRARICAGMGYLGIALDSSRNARSSAVISTGAGRAAVRVIRTDEQLMIARSACRILGLAMRDSARTMAAVASSLPQTTGRCGVIRHDDP